MRGRLIAGTLLLAIGTAWILTFQGITLFPGGFATWWPSFIILVGLAKILLPPRGLLSGALLLVVGGALQAWRLGLVPGLPWAYAAPLALIILGLALVAGAFARKRRRRDWREA